MLKIEFIMGFSTPSRQIRKLHFGQCMMQQTSHVVKSATIRLPPMFTTIHTVRTVCFKKMVFLRIVLRGQNLTHLIVTPLQGVSGLMPL